MILLGFCLLRCLFMCGCTHVHSCMWTPAYKYEETRGQSQVLFQRSCPLYFFETRSLTVTWTSLSRLGQLASKSQRSSHLHFARIRITSVPDFYTGAGKWTFTYSYFYNRTFSFGPSPQSLYPHFFKLLFSVFSYLSSCVCMHVCTCEYRGLWRPEEGIYSSGVTDSCKLPSMSAGSRALGLRRLPSPVETCHCDRSMAVLWKNI